MKSFATALIVAAGIGSIVSGAQNTAPPAGGRTGAGASAADRGTNTVTLVGCLQRGEAGAPAAGAAGAAATAADAFVLANARRTADAATEARTPRTSSSGTTAPDGSGQVTMNYVLEGGAADLTPHVGHRIEVTGTMANTRTTAGTTGTTAPGGPPRFTVTSVRMVSADCSATR